MDATLSTSKTRSKPAVAKLFQNGRSQAVRLPKEFRFEGKEVRIRRTKQGVLLEPMTSLAADVDAWFAKLDSHNAGEAISGGRNQPPMQERDWLD